MKKATAKNPKSKLFLLIGSIIFVLVLLYFGVAFYIANTLTDSKPNPTDDSPTFVAPTVTDITFPAADGVMLQGWFYHNITPSTNKRIIIQVAGFSQNRANDDYYGLFIAHDLYQHGYSILLYDPRESGTPALRKDFGQTRGNDVLGAVHFAEQNGYAPHNIGIIADSLGAVATLMVVDKLQDIGPVVIDSGIARMKSLLELRMSEDYHIPSFLFPGIFLMAQVAYHFNLASVNPVDHVANVPSRPFLFLVGAKDNYVPVENSQELLKAANPASRLVVFPAAGHAHTYKSDPNLYLQTVYQFFDQQFTKS